MNARPLHLVLAIVLATAVLTPSLALAEPGAREAMQRRRSAARYCQERSFRRGERVQGKVVVRFAIDTGGRTSDVRVAEDTTASRVVGRCLARRVER